MKRRGRVALSLAICLLAFLAFGREPNLPDQSLVLEVVAHAGDEQLDCSTTAILTPAGEVATVTRLDFLLSDLALRRLDGSWSEAPDWQAFFSLESQRMEAPPTPFPAGAYTGIRFQVGLEPGLNHADPSRLPPRHPLHPDVNGLHWGWQGGYVFLALEGNWEGPGSSSSDGYSFHLAMDQHFTTIEIPVDIDLRQDRRIRLKLDLRALFHQPHPIRLTETSSTHSRDGDLLAVQLCENLVEAFSLLKVWSDFPPGAEKQSLSAVRLPAGTTPYPFRFSRIFNIPPLPRDNPLTEEGVALGRELFHETRLSWQNRQSCASCHDPAIAFSDRRSVSTGAAGVAGTRNAMPLFNLAWKQTFGWDGTAASLREQVLRPIDDPAEMHESLENAIAKLEAAPAYRAHFARAFGDPAITAERIALALEQFLLTRLSTNSRFDQAIRGEADLTEQEKRGFQLFTTEYDPRRGQFGADCFHCHNGVNFSSHRFTNNGLDAAPKDLGRFVLTQLEADRGKFAVPSLRNVALTGPYMHDGRFETLEEVVEHYSSGIQRSSTLDPNLAKHPDGGIPLPPEDKAALVAFLKSLTDETFGR